MRTVTFDEKKWKVLPIEPTFLMIEAGDQQKYSEEIYKAMLEISPQPEPVKRRRAKARPEALARARTQSAQTGKGSVHQKGMSSSEIPAFCSSK